MKKLFIILIILILNGCSKLKNFDCIGGTGQTCLECDYDVREAECKKKADCMNNPYYKSIYTITGFKINGLDQTDTLKKYNLFNSQLKFSFKLGCKRYDPNNSFYGYCLDPSWVAANFVLKDTVRLSFTFINTCEEPLKLNEFYTKDSVSKPLGLMMPLNLDFYSNSITYTSSNNNFQFLIK